MNTCRTINMRIKLNGGFIVADKTNEILNQLLTGQRTLKADVAVLKEGQHKLETNFAELKEGQHKLETNFAELKEGQHKLETDVAELKTDVAVLKTDVAGLKEGQQRTELFLINMENRIMPIINATYELSKLTKEQLDSTRKAQSEQGEKLENHEIRILRLEHSKH
jgi:ABC-type phosphate transport system auxiliary subunit